MIDGTVSEEFAKAHHYKWYMEEINKDKVSKKNKKEEATTSGEIEVSRGRSLTLES